MTSPAHTPGSVVAGVVIVYECDIDIAVNLATYASDLDMLVVIDNSAMPSPAVAAAVGAYDHAEYLFSGSNLGIAAALNMAIERVRARGADFLLTMDQDSGFDDVPFVVFKTRVLALPFVDDLAIAAPNFIGGNIAEREPETVVAATDTLTVITSGSLVNLANHDRVGPFDEHLFIDDVDHDYCLRAHNAGLRVVSLPTVRLRHRLGQASTVSILGRRVTWNVHGPGRHYYMVRNGLYMFAKHRKTYPGYGLLRLARLTRTIGAALLLMPGRRDRLAMVVRGIRDYRTGQMGIRRDSGVPA